MHLLRHAPKLSKSQGPLTTVEIFYYNRMISDLKPGMVFQFIYSRRQLMFLNPETILAEADADDMFFFIEKSGRDKHAWGDVHTLKLFWIQKQRICYFKILNSDSTIQRIGVIALEESNEEDLHKRSDQESSR